MVVKSQPVEQILALAFWGVAVAGRGVGEAGIGVYVGVSVGNFVAGIGVSVGSSTSLTGVGVALECRVAADEIVGF